MWVSDNRVEVLRVLDKEIWRDVDENIVAYGIDLSRKKLHPADLINLVERIEKDVDTNNRNVELVDKMVAFQVGIIVMNVTDKVSVLKI